MIRVRNTKGDTVDTGGEDRFVEICDADGKIFIVMYQDDNGQIHQVVQGSDTAERYKKMFPGVEFLEKSMVTVDL